MRFKQFLKEYSPRQMKPVKMSLEEILNWVAHNAIRHINNEDVRIWRGVDAPGNAEGLYNGEQLSRKAANTLNYGNLWMSNHSAWSKYPQRSKSFICTTSETEAGDYGEPYIVIPMDSSNIGVCPRNDMWISFRDIMKVSDRNGFDGFMQLTEFLMEMVGGSGHSMEDDWDQFAAALNKIDVDMLSTELKERKYLRRYDKGMQDMVENLLDYMERNNFETLYQVYEHVFDPDFNHFKLEKGANFNAPDRSEVWMSGGVLLVTEATWKKIEETFHL